MINDTGIKAKGLRGIAQHLSDIEDAGMYHRPHTELHGYIQHSYRSADNYFF